MLRMSDLPVRCAHQRPLRPLPDAGPHPVPV